MLQLGEDFPCPLDDGLWDACQPRDFDAVAPVGRPGDQAAEKDDFPVPLPNGDVHGMHTGDFAF